jgi:TPR repeat protein
MSSKRVHEVLLALGTAALLQTGCGHIRWLQKACNRGDAKSCSSLAQRYEKGEGVQKDAAKAVQLFQKACEGGGPEGCHDLGGRNENGSAVPIERAKSQRGSASLKK